MSELRSIVKRSNFEGSLETMLRDCIVCGINDAVIQRRLLSEKDFTYKKALKIAQGIESVAQNVKELMSCPADTRSTAPVHQIKTFKQVVCCRCGKPGHYVPTCKHKETVCTKCGKVGHLQKVCHSKKTNPTKPTEQPISKNSTEQSGSKKGIHTVVDKEADEYGLFNVASPGKFMPWNVNVDIEGVAVTMQLDTGASLYLMSETTFREHWPQRTLSSSQVRLSSYSGESIPE